MLFESFQPPRFSKRKEYRVVMGSRYESYAHLCKNCGCAYGKHYGISQTFCPNEIEISMYAELIKIDTNSLII
jgi:hypothetical protein